MPQKIFLDTEVYRRAHFRLTAPAFNTLRMLAVRGAVQLVHTDITRGEVESQIDALADEASQALAKTSRKVGILRESQEGKFSALFAPVDVTAISRELFENVLDYWDECESEMLLASERSAKDIFSRYFSGTAPFSEPKKKSEFPDAFVAVALVDLASAEEGSLYVVSADPDWVRISNAGPRLRHFETLEAAVDALLADAEPMAAIAHETLDQSGQAIDEQALLAVENAWYVLADVDGEVWNAVVRVAKVDDLQIVAVDGKQATVTASCYSLVILDVHYSDPESGWYDHENGDIHFMKSINTKIEREITVPMSFQVTVDTANIAASRIDNFILNEGNPIAVSVDEDAAAR